MMMTREPAACFLIRLACERCGPVRMAIAEIPDVLECPYCSAGAKFERIGTGQTTRILPYFELEANLEQFRTEPPRSEEHPRLSRGQLVIYCQETNILHFATVNEVWTNAANLSPDGLPSISFLIGGLDTGPVPHISGCGKVPPFWCMPEDLRKASQAETRFSIVTNGSGYAGQPMITVAPTQMRTGQLSKKRAAKRN